MAQFIGDNESLLTAALEGLEIQKQKIEAQMAQVRAMLGKRGPKAAPAAPASGGSAAPAGRRNLSSAARKRIAAAQKKRWIEYRKQKAASQKASGNA